MWKPLGYLTTTPGTPVRVTANETDPTAKLLCHALFLQQVRTNLGFILIGRSGMVEGGANMLAVLAVPTNNSLPNATVGIPEAMNPMNAAEYFIDLTSGGDKCLASVLIL